MTFGVVGAVGQAITQAGAVKGEGRNIADSFPHHLRPGTTRLLCATDRRLLFLLVSGGTHRTADLIWQVPRSTVIAVERRPRLQLMAKFRLRFADGSAVSVLTMRRHTVDSLAGALGGSRG
jgi:hypothetical protein